MDVAQVLERQVRDAVRDAGIDPIADGSQVRLLVERELARYDDQVLRGHASPIDDVSAVTDEIVDAVSGFGPLQRFLADDSIEEIWIKG